ncbi:MAG: glycosyltransferase family 2 protein [Crocinitomicaceae bacterium]
MKVSGFTFIRNAIKYDYPIVEAIQSILPLCDEVVVAVGNSEDETLALIQNIDPKIRVIETIWDDNLREGGRTLALETDKAYAAISEDSDWAFYIQGDEVLHERYLPVIKEAMLAYKDDQKVDGLLFNYKHFYGSYDYIGTSISWYPDEIRIVRKRKDIYSYRDAQGFRKGDDEKLSVKRIPAWMYHYGWVKPPEKMQLKQESFHKMWHDDAWMQENVKTVKEFDYTENIDALARFEESHPNVMQDRIATKNWKFEYDISFNRIKPKDKVKYFLRKYLGVDIRYKNFVEL